MPQSDPTQKYIREVCRALDAKYDREALWLLCGVGVFDVDDGGDNLEQAVLRLRDEPDGAREKVVAAQEAAAKGATYEKRQAAVLQLEDIENTRYTESIEKAYLLGIAVGRRLGPAALRIDGGAR